MNAALTSASERVDPDAVLRTFLEMVRIDSPSGEEDAMREYLAGRMTALGLPHRTDEGGNLIVEVPAHACNHERILVLSGHMDVVPPCLQVRPIVEKVDGDWIIHSDNTTVLGADDKSGLAPIVEAVARSLRDQSPRPRLRLIFTTREETMLGGAKALSDESLDAHFAITLDHTGRQGVIITEAPSYIEFEATCIGKSVHAGIMPEEGVNAIVFASRVIERLHPGRIDNDTTCNIGFLTGGKATNIVPDRAVIRGELRGHHPETLRRELAHIEETLALVSRFMPGTTYEWRHEQSFERYKIDGEHAGVRNVMQAARKTGLTPQTIRTNGGSDNNVFVQRGLPGVVLSACFIEPHSLKERVKLSEMVQSTAFLLNLLETFAHDPF